MHVLCQGSAVGQEGICSVSLPLGFQNSTSCLHVYHASCGASATPLSKQHQADREEKRHPGLNPNPVLSLTFD